MFLDPLTAQRDRLRELGAAEEHIYLDHGLVPRSFPIADVMQTPATHPSPC
jgi:hypothetical protein